MPGDEPDVGEWSTMWEGAVGLLRAWNGRPDDHEPALHSSDEEWSAWADLAGIVEDHFAGRQHGGLDDADRAWLQHEITESTLSPWDAGHAAAWGLDAAGWPTFTEVWLPTGEERETVEGNFFPVCDMDADLVGPEITSRPASLGVSVDELPHIRALSDTEGLRVVFDSRFSIGLTGVLTQLRQLISVHPNEKLDEFHLPEGAIIHGVRPADLDRQAAWLTAALDIALGDGHIVVFPELCVTDGLVDGISSQLEEIQCDCLVVAGSVHATEGGNPVNIAFALLPGEQDRMVHRKLVPMEGKEQKEGIVRGSELRIWTADRWRMAICICKDSITPAYLHLLARLGVNLLLIPAMTPKVDPFEATVMTIAISAQGFVVVANNPREFDGKAVTSAVFGQPVTSRVLRTFPGHGDTWAFHPGICRFSIGGDLPYWENV